MQQLLNVSKVIKMMPGLRSNEVICINHVGVSGDKNYRLGCVVLIRSDRQDSVVFVSNKGTNVFILRCLQEKKI